MKKESAYVIFQVPVGNGKYETTKVYTEDLRKLLNDAKISKDANEIELRFEYGQRKFAIPMKVSDIRKLIKQSELCVDIVPKSLSKYLVDYTRKMFVTPQKPIVGRENELEKAWFYLSQPKRNNVFLVGEKDVGKSAIAIEIARQISNVECPKEFYNTHVLMLRPEMLLKIRNKNTYIRTIRKIIAFLVKNKKNVILYVDKAIYLKVEVALVSILTSCVMKYNIPLITTSSIEDYEDYFEDDPSIVKYLNYIYVEEPELEELEPMLKEHIIKLKKQYKIKISKEMIKFGIFTSKLSDSVSINPGNVINIFERAFLEAKRKDKTEVDKKCILSCYNTSVKEYQKMQDEEKMATAYHETGHYMLAVKSDKLKDIKISCVSNLPTRIWGGVTMPYYNQEDFAVRSREYYIDYIAFLLGGRVAEKKFTSLNSTGAENDLERANEIARVMVMSWGFSDDKDNLNREYPLRNAFIIPESKKELIDNEIQQIIKEATEKAEVVIAEHEELLKIIAEKLFEEEVLIGEQLTKICEEYSSKKDNKQEEVSDNEVEELAENETDENVSKEVDTEEQVSQISEEESSKKTKSKK